MNTAFPYCDQQQTSSMRETAAMRTFAFETTIDAVVRVQAADEDSARRAVPTVLAAPGIATSGSPTRTLSPVSASML